jgi:hypothetical protein
MSVPEQFARATFTPQIGRNTKPIHVHFNPVSLQYTIANTMKENKKKKQYVSQTTGKLTMDLVFDTTLTGEDVRARTAQIAKFMEPQKSTTQVPPVVEFQWGTYRFRGMFESFKETIDFFAANGVPLRSTVNLTMAEQDVVFAADAAEGEADKDKDADDLVDVPVAQGDDATSTASRGCSPGAGRDVAAANGQESMRFLIGGSLTIGGGVPLGPPVGFSAGVSGAALGVSTSAGVSVGSSASAGVSASAGAFAGLRAPARPPTPLCVDRLVPPPVSAVATDRGATFDLGGAADKEESASMGADVGAKVCVRSRIQFEQD